jgi:hypothetical protein
MQLRSSTSVFGTLKVVAVSVRHTRKTTNKQPSGTSWLQTKVMQMLSRNFIKPSESFIRTVRVFVEKSTLEDAIGSHACSLEASACVTNGILLGFPVSYRIIL